MKRLLLFLPLFFAVVNAFSQEAPEGLFIDSKAPDFRSKDQDDKEVRLKDVLKKGKVILVFYRGQWCPYCNRFLVPRPTHLHLKGHVDRKSTRLNSSHSAKSRMPSSA